MHILKMRLCMVHVLLVRHTDTGCKVIGLHMNPWVDSTDIASYESRAVALDTEKLFCKEAVWVSWSQSHP